jgi:hypothetical protein
MRGVAALVFVGILLSAGCTASNGTKAPEAKPLPPVGVEHPEGGSSCGGCVPVVIPVSVDNKRDRLAP